MSNSNSNSNSISVELDSRIPNSNSNSNSISVELDSRIPNSNSNSNSISVELDSRTSPTQTQNPSMCQKAYHDHVRHQTLDSLVNLLTWNSKLSPNKLFNSSPISSLSQAKRQMRALRKQALKFSPSLKGKKMRFATSQMKLYAIRKNIDVIFSQLKLRTALRIRNDRLEELVQYIRDKSDYEIDYTHSTLINFGSYSYIEPVLMTDEEKNLFPDFDIATFDSLTTFTYSVRNFVSMLRNCERLNRLDFFVDKDGHTLSQIPSSSLAQARSELDELNDFFTDKDSDFRPYTDDDRDYFTEGFEDFCASGIKKALPNLASKFDDITTSLQDASDEHKTFFQRLNNLFTSLTQTLPYTPSVSKIVKKLAISAGLCAAQRSFIPLVTTILLEFVEMGLDDMLFKYIITSTRQIWDNCEEVYFTEADEETFSALSFLPSWISDISSKEMLSRLISFIPTLIIGLIAASITTLYSKAPDFHRLMDSIRNSGMTLKAMYEGKKGLTSICSDVENSLCIALTGKSVKEAKEMRDMPALPAIQDILLQLTDPAKQNSLSQDVNSCKHILSIDILLQKYLLIAQNQNDRPLTATIQSLIENNKKFMRIAHGTLAQNKSARARPATLYLYGTPGTGKSTMCQLFMERLIKEQYPGKTELEIVFNRTEGTEFWDGYHTDNKIIFYDDLGQMKEMAAAGNMGQTASEFIKLVNTAPYLLDMSGTTSSAVKGGTYCTPDYVLCTSNINMPSSQGIASNDAYQRRFDFLVKVDIKKEYKLKNSQRESINIPYLAYTQNKDKFTHFNNATALTATQASEVEVAIERGDITVKFDPSIYSFKVDAINSTLKRTTHIMTFDELFKALRQRQQRYANDHQVVMERRGQEVPAPPELTKVFSKWAKLLNIPTAQASLKFAKPCFCPFNVRGDDFATTSKYKSVYPSMTSVLDNPKSYIKISCVGQEDPLVVSLPKPFPFDKSQATLDNLKINFPSQDKRSMVNKIGTAKFTEIQGIEALHIHVEGGWLFNQFVHKCAAISMDQEVGFTVQQPQGETIFAAFTVTEDPMLSQDSLHQALIPLLNKSNEVPEELYKPVSESLDRYLSLLERQTPSPEPTVEDLCDDDCSFHSCKSDYSTISSLDDYDDFEEHEMYDIHSVRTISSKELPYIDPSTCTQSTVANLARALLCEEEKDYLVVETDDGHDFIAEADFGNSAYTTLDLIKDKFSTAWRQLVAVPSWVWGTGAAVLAALFVGGLAIYKMYYTECKVLSYLKEGDNFLTLFSTRTCFSNCQFCKKMKKASWSKIMLTLDSKGMYSFTSYDKTNFCTNIVQLAKEFNVTVNPSILCDALGIARACVPDVVMGEMEITTEGRTRVLTTEEQLKKRSEEIESHQNRKLNRRFARTEDDWRQESEDEIESHQNRKLRKRMPRTENDDKYVPPHKRDATESYQKRKLKRRTVRTEAVIQGASSSKKLQLGTIHYDVVEEHSSGWKKIKRQNFKTNTTSEIVGERSGKLTAKVESAGALDFFVEASYDTNATELVDRAVTKLNLVKLIVDHTGQQTSTCGLFVSGRIMLVPRHLFDPQPEFVTIVTYDGQCQKTRIVNQIPVTTAEGESVDLVLAECERNISARPNITKHFISSKQLSFLPSHLSPYCKIITLRPYKRTANLALCLEGVHDSHVEYTKRRARGNGNIYTTIDSITYNANTQYGDCGGPFVIYDPSIDRKIAGLHVAGSTGFGYSQLVTIEMLERNLRDFGFQVQMEAPMLDQVEDNPLDNSLYLGEIKDPIHMPKDSKIDTTSLHGIFEVKTAPAVLYDKEVDILMKNAAKMTKDTPLLDNDILDKCENDVLSTLNANKRTPKIYTLAEAIQGTDEDYVEPLNRSTSPGYPYVHERQGNPGKTKWLGSAEDYIIDHPDVVDRVNRMIDNARAGIYTPLEGAFIASLKDERRTLSKVQAMKTRVFTACNITLALAIRMYFLDFLRHCMENKIDNEIALGTNVYSLDWTRIARHVKRTGGPIIAGDFSNFDGSLNSQILFRICDVINRWYNDGEENAHIRTTLFHYLVNACIIFRHQTLVLNHSQPSGNPLTTLINCMYNMFIFRYVYSVLKKEALGNGTLFDYAKNVSGEYYGDDSLIGINPDILEWFNQITITDAMKRTGHEYTDETKTTSQVTHKSLEDVTFLKRTFVPVPGFPTQSMAPLARDTIEDMVMWKNTKITDDDALAQVVPMATVEASLHGRDYYDYFTSTILSSLRTRFKIDVPSYSDCTELLECQRLGQKTDNDLLRMFFDRS
nr:hypothetical protein 1 [Wenzhou shrimp virus 6]